MTENATGSSVAQIGCMIVDRLSGTPIAMTGDDSVVADLGVDGVKRSVGRWTLMLRAARQLVCERLKPGPPSLVHSHVCYRHLQFFNEQIYLARNLPSVASHRSPTGLLISRPIKLAWDAIQALAGQHPGKRGGVCWACEDLRLFACCGCRGARLGRLAFHNVLVVVVQVLLQHAADPCRGSCSVLCDRSNHRTLFTCIASRDEPVRDI